MVAGTRRGAGRHITKSDALLVLEGVGTMTHCRLKKNRPSVLHKMCLLAVSGGELAL